jgi:hypothetical protein
MPVSVRLVSADGRVDAEVPGQLSVDVGTEFSASDVSSGTSTPAGEIESLSIHTTIPPSALDESSAVSEVDDTGFSLNVWKNAEGVSAEAFVMSLVERSPNLRAPIDETAGEARCVVASAAAAAEVER